MSATATGGLAERLEEAIRKQREEYPRSVPELSEVIWGAADPWSIQLGDPGDDSFLGGDFIGEAINKALEAVLEMAKPVIIETLLQEMRNAPSELLDDPRSEVLRADLAAA